jgi:hypothetical protein
MTGQAQKVGSSSSVPLGEAEQTAAEGASIRRLITLIFVDRDKPAIMVVIRRELPRTRIADLAYEPVA